MSTSALGKKQSSNRLRPRALLLEPRIFLDAAAVVGAIAQFDSDSTDSDWNHESNYCFDSSTDLEHQRAVQELIEAAGGVVPPAFRTDQDENEDQGEGWVETSLDIPQGVTHVFFDSNVPGLDKLQSGVSDQAIVTVINPDEHGLDVITRTLAEHGPVTAVHIFSHGQSGQILLGDDPITMDSLKADHRQYLSQWQGYLSEGADILIYGCSLAEGESGKLFVDKISKLTGADVAASDDPTGHHELGGNWKLEYATGSIEALNPINAEVLGAFGYLLDSPEATGIADASAEADRITPEDTPLNIGGISVSGDEAAEITLSIVTTDGTSTLTLGDTTLASGELGSDSFSITGTVANVNTALTTLTYTPTVSSQIGLHVIS